MKLIFNKFKLNFLLIFCWVIFFVSLLFSPVITVLFLPSIYYIYKGNYKNLCFIWVFYFVSWYVVFTLCMFHFEGSIIIGEGFTGNLVFYTIDTYSDCSSPFNWLGSILYKFCMQTILYLDLLSNRLGCCIYIPSIYKGFLALIQFFF